MKLKTLSIINRVTTFLMGFVMLPFAVVHCVLHYLSLPFKWVYDDFLMGVRQRIGNRLLHMADEVKDGRISIPHYLKHGTASFVYRECRHYKNVD